MYQFGADESTLRGSWENGNITSGKWVLQDGTVSRSFFFLFPSSWFYEISEEFSLLNRDVLLRRASQLALQVYTGTFKDGRVMGSGVYEFPNGITQKGEYVEVPRGEDAEESEEPPALKWIGNSVLAC